MVINRVSQIVRKISSSSVIRHSFVYVFCDGVNKAIPFLLLPFITHYLTPADYGLITNFNVYVQIFTILCYLCSAAALPVQFHKLTKEKVKEFVSNMIFLNTCATVLCVLLVFSSASSVKGMLNLGLGYQLTAQVLVWFAGITNANMVLWRCEEKPLAFGLYQILQSALNAVSTILFVIVWLKGWEGRVYSMVLSTVVFGIFSIHVLYKRGYLILKLSKEYLRLTFAFVIPIIPHGLSFWFKSGLDKVMLSNMCGLTENGLYSVSMTWGAVVSMFLMSFNNAYTPMLFKKLVTFDKNPEETLLEQCKLVKFIWMSIAVTFVFVILAYIVSYVLITIMYPPSYHASQEYLPWVMTGRFFYGSYLMFVCFIHYTLKTKVLGSITFSLSIIQIGITYLFILWLGAVGAAMSSAFGSALTCVCVAAYAMKVYKLHWFSFRN